MKFAELKSSLNKNILNAYYIAGKDAYLRDSAESMIKKRCVNFMPEFNTSQFNDENFDIDKVVGACNSVPMGDQFRVVVLNGVVPDKNSVSKLEKYLKNVNSTTCLIIKDAVGFSGYKSIIPLCEKIDCDFLDAKMLEPLIVNKLSKANVKIDSQALKLLIEYCNFDMTFINLEIKKLSSYSAGQIIDAETINKLVHKNLEYSVFELGNAVAERNRKKAFELLNLMLENKESPQNLLLLLLSNFRRVFYVSVTKASDKEIADMLDVKEYSIKIARRLLQNFTPKKLKKLLDLGGKLDFDIKNGKIDDKNAIYCFVSNALCLN